MSRKDYILIARAIREVYDRQDDDTEKYAIRQTVDNLCVYLKSDNWNFDRERFRTAALGT